MQTSPFKRAHMMMAAISAAMALGNTMLQKMALDAISPYKSRGHGKGFPSKRYGNACSNWQVKLGDTMNGKRACNRRRKQLNAIAKSKFVNFIFLTGEKQPMALENDDRRFRVEI